MSITIQKGDTNAYFKILNSYKSTEEVYAINYNLKQEPNGSATLIRNSDKYPIIDSVDPTTIINGDTSEFFTDFAAMETYVTTNFIETCGCATTDASLLTSGTLADARLSADVAFLASPAFTGTPTAPTPAPGDNSTNIATTAFVDNALTSKAPLASPALTGSPTAPTPTAGDNSTNIATTAFVDTALTDSTVYFSAAFNGTGAYATPIGLVTDAAPVSASVNPVQSGGVFTALAAKAPLASPALTGTPTAPTQTAGDNSTKIATTAYVDTTAATKAPLASPALTGNPTAPTQTALDDSTKIATTAYTDSAITAIKVTGTRFLAPSGYLEPPASATNDSYGANNIGVCKFYLPFSIVLNSLKSAVITADASSSTIQLGIYSSAGNLLAGTSGLSSTTTGIKTGTVTSVTLAPGFYWLAYVTNSSTVRVEGYYNTGQFWDNTVTGTASNVVSGGVMPATLGTVGGGTGNNPAIIMLSN